MAVGRRSRQLVPPEVQVAIQWRSSWSGKLLKKYAGAWVAVSGRKVLATAPTHERLSARLDALGRPPVYIFKVEAPGLVVY